MDIMTEGYVVSLGVVGYGQEYFRVTHALVECFAAFFEFLGLLLHFEIEDSGLVTPHPAQAPAGGRYVGYGLEFHGIGGPKDVDVGVEHFQEVGLAFILEDKGFGGEAVGGGVHRRVGTALRSLGA